MAASRTTSRDEAAARRTAGEVGDAGARPVLLRADFTVAPDSAGMRGAAAARAVAAAWDGPLDVLVNNAGLNGAQPLGEIDEDTYDRVLAVNLTAPLFLTQALAPRLRPGGRVINVSTGFTRVAAPTHPVYAAAKAAVNTLTLALAPALGARAVTINAVLPGVIDTDLNADWLDAPGARDGVAARSVLGRVGDPADVADVVRFLAGDGSRWITGQTIDVTGGAAL